MKQHDGGRRGGHTLAMRRPTRRVCRQCGGTYVGLRLLCGACDRRAIPLVTRRDNDDEPPRAA